MKHRGLVLLAIALAGCAPPWADDGAAESTGFDRGLAGRATEQTVSAPPTSGPAEPATGPDGSGDAGTATGRPTGDTVPGSGDGALARRLGWQPDATGDAGVGAPAYADLVEVELVDNGSSLRVAIGVAGAIPRTLGDREAAGIGVDLYVRDGGTESDYQIFLEGAADGWFAYLETTSGLQQFVGTFELAGDRFIVTVPWSALDDHRSGRVAVFADASSAVLAVAVSSEDHAPEGDPTAFG